MSRYDWLKEEISRIPKKKFHVIEPRSLSDLAQIEASYGQLPPDYREFAQEFGNAALYRPRWGGDGHMLLVMVPPIPQVDEDAVKGGKRIVRLRLGHYIETGYAWVEWNDGSLIDDGGVFAGWSQERRKLAPSFEAWLRHCFRDARKAYSKGEWLEVLKPVLPFDLREQQIVDAMAHFAFRKLGTTPDGKVRIEIENRSSLELMYFTVGVREPSRMVGTHALPVSGLAPGTATIIERSIYEGSMDPERLELYRLALPDPEDRPYCAEFRTTPFPQASSSSGSG